MDFFTGEPMGRGGTDFEDFWGEDFAEGPRRLGSMETRFDDL